MKNILLIVLLVTSSAMFSQVGIGTDQPEGALDVVSSTSGLIVSRVPDVTAVVSPVNGMVVYDISTSCLKAYENGTWSGCFVPGRVSGFDCDSVTHTGDLEENTLASGVSSSLDYTGGNGRHYDAQVIGSIGVTGLTASLAAGTLARGTGSLEFTISGTPTGYGTAIFIIKLGGRVCTITRFVTMRPGIVSSLDCAGATHVGTLEDDTVAIGVLSSVGYTGGNGGLYASQTVSSTGVTGLTASLASGVLNTGTGNLEFSISGTPSSSGTASFSIAIGGQTCVFTREVLDIVGVISSLNCSERRNEGILYQGEVAVAVKTTLSYIGGNGLGYDGLTINSTGVTGLTASLPSGSFTMGNGDLVFSISGTPGGSGGVASFAVTIGGRSCVFKRLVAGSGEVMISSNLVWKDKNLGASQVATAKKDAASFGDLYQWGRNTDGHEKRSSTSMTGPVAAGSEGGDFITSSSNDWLTVRDDVRWNSGTMTEPVKGVHDPCPSGYRVPTKIEMLTDFDTFASYDSEGAFNSPLKLPSAGYRNADGSFSTAHPMVHLGRYWTTDFTGGRAVVMNYSDTNGVVMDVSRALGASIRCVRVDMD